MLVKVGLATGKCPTCGRIYIAHRPADMITCDCYRFCPICGAEMKPYTPDLIPNTYGRTRVCELKVLFYCDRHSPTHYSGQKPVEVIME